jgi:hypothetical protein
LFAAVDRLLKNWTSLIFLSQGKENVNRAIWTFVAYENDCEVADEQTLPELYLYFAHNVVSLFNVSIKHVESNYIQITEIYSVFSKLKNEFDNRQEKNSYGFKVLQHLKKLSPQEQKTFIQDAQRVYNRILDYLDRWFDFGEDSFYRLCAPLNLDGPRDMDAMLNLLNVEVDGDQLFSEICDLNDVLPFIKGELETSVSGPGHSENK